MLVEIVFYSSVYAYQLSEFKPPTKQDIGVEQERPKKTRRT
jgi:hypothetical protein